MRKLGTLDAYTLMHEGSIALAQVEANGAKIDIERLDHNTEEVQHKIAKLEKELRADDVFKAWKRRFGGKTNLGSRAQLGTILFDAPKAGGLGLEGGERTKSGQWQTDEAVLEHVDHPFVPKYLRAEELKKLEGTYLRGLRKHVCLPDAYIHANYNLNLVVTHRGSCDSPNLQNVPIRNPEIGKYIRSCFIPRGKKRCIVELDYSGIEVRVAVCYHKDPTMLRYIKDPTKDMHRDMAGQIYFLASDMVSKMARYCAKNMYVFPQFYGDWYVNNTKSLWDAMTKHKLMAGDVPMMEHLRKHGIKKRGACSPDAQPLPGTFELHLQKIERDFWDRRFRVYGQWKRDWFDAYQRCGGFRTLTGFWIEGVFKRNEVINYPVQGSAFHCLLWSLVRLQRWLTKNKMWTVVIGQIHDSMLLDVYEPELDEVLAMAKHIMTETLREKWPWIIVPLDVEAGVSPVGKSWFDKEERKL